jgi:hypothetical protein
MHLRTPLGTHTKVINDTPIAPHLGSAQHLQTLAPLAARLLWRAWAVLVVVPWVATTAVGVARVLVLVLTLSLDALELQGQAIRLANSLSVVGVFSRTQRWWRDPLLKTTISCGRQASGQRRRVPKLYRDYRPFVTVLHCAALCCGEFRVGVTLHNIAILKKN